MAGKLVEGWCRGQRILDEFIQQFQNQYLQCLREKSNNNKNQRSSRITPKVGDHVQIKDDGPRVKWRTGKICNLIKSKDGEVRVAVVRSDGKELTRSIKHLYPLEIEISQENTTDTNNSEELEDAGQDNIGHIDG